MPHFNFLFFSFSISIYAVFVSWRSSLDLASSKASVSFASRYDSNITTPSLSCFYLEDSFLENPKSAEVKALRSILVRASLLLSATARLSFAIASSEFPYKPTLIEMEATGFSMAKRLHPAKNCSSLNEFVLLSLLVQE